MEFVTVDLEPSRVEIPLNIFDESTAYAALFGVYSQLNSDSAFASGRTYSLCVTTGLTADELICHSKPDRLGQFYNNAISPENEVICGLNYLWINYYKKIEPGLWLRAYKNIHYINRVLMAVDTLPNISPGAKYQIEGEAKFLRAFHYFYLVNLFGDVPIVVQEDWRINQYLPRSPIDDVYALIINDLTTAAELLPHDYTEYNGQKTRANYYAAIALLARVYLYRKQWNNAEYLASTVINSNLYKLVEHDSVFLANSQEAIWQIRPPKGFTTELAKTFKRNPPIVSMTESLYQSFAANDQRRKNWIGRTLDMDDKPFIFCNKYKDNRTGRFHLDIEMSPLAEEKEYQMVIRLAEILLIRSEARCFTGDTKGSREDINKVRNRSGLPNTTAETPDELFQAIQEERRHELFTEWGHRWLDLKRWGIASEILSTKGTDWQATDVLFPLPEREIRITGFSQNPGY